METISSICGDKIVKILLPSYLNDESRVLFCPFICIDLHTVGDLVNPICLEFKSDCLFSLFFSKFLIFLFVL